MATLMTPGVSHPGRQSPARGRRLLVVADAAERASRWRGVAGRGGAEVLTVILPGDLQCVCSGTFDVVVVDVGPARLVEVLTTLRGSAGCAESPVLVEAGRICAAPGLCGVLPRHRAMPCGGRELARLAQRLLAGRSPEGGQRRLTL